MPIHRRRIYHGEHLGRRRRIENRFSYSIFVAIVLLIFTGPVFLYQLMEAGLEKWPLPRDSGFSWMLRPPPAQPSLLRPICALVASLAIVYLAVALSIKWKLRTDSARWDAQTGHSGARSASLGHT